MTALLSLLLAEIKRVVACTAIEVDVLPLPPGSFPDARALLVNCYFRPDVLATDGPQLLAVCRKYVNHTLRTIEEFVRQHEIDFDTIGVSLFYDSEAMSGTRVYWANSRKDLLSKPGDQVTCEGSHLEELRCLLSTGRLRDK